MCMNKHILRVHSISLSLSVSLSGLYLSVSVCVSLSLFLSHNNTLTIFWRSRSFLERFSVS